MVRRMPVEEKDGDLGFGSLAAQPSRLINPDGTFEVARVGRGLRAALNAYHTLLTSSWGRFLLLLAAVYFAFNLLFGAVYLSCGPGAITGPETGGPFWRAFFLAVQTSSTVGYGQLAPAGAAANFAMVVQAFLSLVLVALGTGLVFTRFSRPRADLAWSNRAVVAPYRGITGLMFRLANRRKDQLFDLHAKVILSLFEEQGGRRTRRFFELELERTKVSFLPLSWTVVHPIDENSPLHKVTEEQFRACSGEIIVLLRGRDATTSQDIHAWTSYGTGEVVFDARFVRIYDHPSAGPVRMDVSRIHEYETV